MQVRIRSSLAIAVLLAACVEVTPAFAGPPAPMAVHAAPQTQAVTVAAPIAQHVITFVSSEELDSLGLSHDAQVIGALGSLPMATLSVCAGTIECTPSIAVIARARTEYARLRMPHGNSATMRSTNGGDAKVLSATSHSRRT